RGGLEGDVEVVTACEAMLCDMPQRVAHDAAQRLFDHLLVSQNVVRHRCERSIGVGVPATDSVLLTPTRRRQLPAGTRSDNVPTLKWGASVARCPPDRACLMVKQRVR